MFASIDKTDWAALAECFHPEAWYERPGYERLVGRERLMRFYREERGVVDGRHIIDGLLVGGGDGAAWGRMSGVLRSGETVQVGFSEVYRFVDGLIGGRRSYFFTPTV